MCARDPWRVSGTLVPEAASGVAPVGVGPGQLVFEPGRRSHLGARQAGVVTLWSSRAPGLTGPRTLFLIVPPSGAPQGGRLPSWCWSAKSALGVCRTRKAENAPHLPQGEDEGRSLFARMLWPIRPFAQRRDGDVEPGRDV